MAITKNTLASATYITTNNSTTVTYTPAVRADVSTVPASLSSSSVAIGLKPSIHMTNPGVFTVGTAPEGTLSNPTNDSNN